VPTPPARTPLIYALARLIPAASSVHIVLAEPIQTKKRKVGKTLEEEFHGNKGLLLLDRFAKVGTARYGRLEGFQLWLLDRGGYALLHREGSWSEDEEPSWEEWRSELRLQTPAEAFYAAGGELSVRELFAGIGKKFWAYANRHPHEAATRRIEALANWAAQCSLGKVNDRI
jgi:hypothetical protein